MRELDLTRALGAGHSLCKIFLHALEAAHDGSSKLFTQTQKPYQVLSAPAAFKSRSGLELGQGTEGRKKLPIRRNVDVDVVGERVNVHNRVTMGSLRKQQIQTNTIFRRVQSRRKVQLAQRGSDSGASRTSLLSSNTPRPQLCLLAVIEE
jgi:hypothetical protein